MKLTTLFAVGSILLILACYPVIPGDPPEPDTYNDRPFCMSGFSFNATPLDEGTEANMECRVHLPSIFGIAVSDIGYPNWDSTGGFNIATEIDADATIQLNSIGEGGCFRFKLQWTADGVGDSIIINTEGGLDTTEFILLSVDDECIWSSVEGVNLNECL